MERRERWGGEVRGGVVRGLVLCLVIGVVGCDGGKAAGRQGGKETAPGSYELGRAPTPEELAAWDKSVNPTGKNLPPGQGTVAEGKVVFAAKCSMCHGDEGQGMPPAYPQLVGKDPTDFGAFDTDFKITHTIGNYWPYATTLYDYINRAMPLTAPGSLQPAEIYAVVAYLLAANGVIADSAVMNATTLPAVRMPARDRFVVDDRAGGGTFR
jgi:mono/diheme cytochrome c family protein